MEEDLKELVESGTVMGAGEVLAVLSGIIRGEGLDGRSPDGSHEAKVVWPTHGNILSAIDMYFKYGSRFLGGEEQARGVEPGGWFKDG